MTIQELYDNVHSINLLALREKVLLSISPEIIKTIQEDQLQLGIDANGQSLPTYKNPKYAELKATMNPNSQGNWDLSLTGSFYEKMFIELTGEDLVVDSSDEKTSDLIGKTGGAPIMSLTSDNFEFIKINNAVPEFMIEFKNLAKID